MRPYPDTPHRSAAIANQDQRRDAIPGPLTDSCILIRVPRNQGPVRTGAILVLTGVLVGLLISEFLLLWSGGCPRMSATTHALVAFSLIISGVHVLDLARRTTVVHLPRQ